MDGLGETDCACGDPVETTCSGDFPRGHYSISVALPESVNGTLQQEFADGLYNDHWDDMYHCDDGIVIAVDLVGNVSRSLYYIYMYIGIYLCLKYILIRS